MSNTTRIPERCSGSIKYYVYQMVDPKSNIPFYIGKGMGNRMYYHEALTLSGKVPHGNKLLFHKIKKILSESGTICYKKTDESLSEEDALKKEQFYIRQIGKRIDGTGPLCNITDGGEGVSGLKHSDQTKKKMSILSRQPHRIRISCQNAKKASQQNTGKRKLTKRHKEIVQMYKTHPMKYIQLKLGCDFTTLKRYLIESRLFIPNKNRKDTEVVLAKKSIANKGKRSRPVRQFDLHGTHLKTWENISSACLSLGKPNRQGDIWTCCSGGQKTAFGYRWSFV